jgi:hypothetical protein
MIIIGQRRCASGHRRVEGEVEDVIIIEEPSDRIVEWCPPGRQRNGRPRNSWM